MRSLMAFRIIVLLYSLSVLSAPKDQMKDARNKGENRSMMQTTFPHKVSLTSVALEKRNAFRTEFSTKGFPNIRTRYMTGGNGTEKSVSSFRTGILCISEYNDTISPADSKNLIRLVGKKDVTWSNIQVDTDYNGTSVTRAVSSGSGNGAFSGFNITIEVFATPIDSTLEGKYMQPNDTKISITIRNFPYIYNQSKIAIHFGIWSKHPRQNNGSHLMSSGSIFTWDNTVVADGNISTISKIDSTFSMDSQNEDDEQSEALESQDLIAFGVNAEHAQFIYWDPDMIQGDSEISSGATLGRTIAFMIFLLYYIVV